MSKWQTLAYMLMVTGIISLVIGFVIMNIPLIVIGLISMILSIFLPS